MAKKTKKKSKANEINGEKVKEVSIKMGGNYKPKGDVDFTVYIVYKDKQLQVWLDPPSADPVLVRGVLQIALLELSGIDTDQLKKRQKAIEKKIANKKSAYMV